jgi:hypothetical protein
LCLRVLATLCWPHSLAMKTLVLLNSSSPGYAEGRELILPLYVTLDEAVRYVRATRTSHLESRRYDATTGKVTAVFTGCADVPTHFHLFTETDGEIRTTLVDVPAFEDEITIVQLCQGRK